MERQTFFRVPSVVKKFLAERGIGAYITLAGLIIVAAVCLMAIFAPIIAPHDPTKSVGEPLLHPNDKFPMGTDLLGRDMYSRILYGSRTVMIVAILSTILSSIVGVPVGLLSGYVGGRLDRLFSLIMDSIYAFPGLILAIAITAVLGPGLVNMAIAITVIYIPTYFRMVRGQVLSLREVPFVEAARAIGAKGRTVMLRYILPAVMPSIVVVFSLNIVDAILTEAALCFLGLGLPAPTPDWGFDLRSGQAFLLSGHWWLITFPGLMIILTAIGFSLLGEGLNEIISPRLREL